MAIKNIYKNRIPDISSIELDEIIINTGDCFVIRLVITTNDIPDIVPSKWKDRNINSISFTFSLYNAFINKLSLNDLNRRTLNLSITELSNGFKKIIAKDEFGKITLEVETEFISIFSISGTNRKIHNH